MKFDPKYRFFDRWKINQKNLRKNRRNEAKIETNTLKIFENNLRKIFRNDFLKNKPRFSLTKQRKEREYVKVKARRK